VSPIGKAWISSMSQLPGENLYYSDNPHPSLEGVYLTAATIFTTIFKTDLTNVNYSGGINSTSAQTMRTIAFNTVTDAAIYPATHLNAYTPSITVNGNTLTCPGTYSSYQWYENGNTTGTNSNIYTAITNGPHKVVVTDSSGCLMSSFEVNLTTVGISSNEIASDNMSISTLSNNVFEVLSNKPGLIFVFTMQGELINSAENKTGQTKIDLSNRAKGIYIIAYTNSQTRIFKKILVN
jgi:hypothetical protein